MAAPATGLVTLSHLLLSILRESKEKLLKTFFSAFAGKIVATIAIAAIAALGLGGPDVWISYLAQGTDFLTPQAVRAVLVCAALSLALVLLLLLFKQPRKGEVTYSQLAYALSIDGLSLGADKLAKRRLNLQIGVNLRNTSQITIRYYVDFMDVQIDGNTIPKPQFSNRGIVIRPGDTDLFRYPAHQNISLPQQCEVRVSLNISYGAADGQPLRHIRRDYVATLHTTNTNLQLAWSISGEDLDQPI